MMHPGKTFVVLALSEYKHVVFYTDNAEVSCPQISWIVLCAQESLLRHRQTEALKNNRSQLFHYG